MKRLLIICAAAVSVPLMSSAETYQYIITPGYDPAVASTNRCGLAVSAVSSVATGKVPAPGVASGETTSRYRTLTASNVSALNARKWRQCYIDFR